MPKPKFGIAIYGSDSVQQVVAQVKLAEDLGYNTAWLADTQLAGREVYVTLAACALNTSLIRLGTGVTNPYTRHPSITASAFATLNDLAEGRLCLGISIGDSAVRTLGGEPPGIGKLEEHIKVVKGLLRNEPVRFDEGAEGKIAWLDTPLDIPIYVAGSGRRVIRAGARTADGVLLLAGVSRRLLERALGYIKEGAAQASRSIKDVDVVCWTLTSISNNRRVAREQVRGLVTATLRLAKPETFVENEEELKQVQRIHQEFNYSHYAEADSLYRELAPEKFIDRLALVGTPEDIREQVKEIRRVYQFSEIVINTPFSSADSVIVESTIKDFAEKVMAHVA